MDHITGGISSGGVILIDFFIDCTPFIAKRSGATEQGTLLLSKLYLSKGTLGLVYYS